MSIEHPTLKGKRVALLVTDGFEQVELTSPKEALENAGAKADIIADQPGEVTGWHHTDPGDHFKVDNTFDKIQLDDYDAVVLPGGVVNADHIRMDDAAITFVQGAVGAGKPIAVICHGAWLLISAGVVKGKQITSFPSLKDDLKNAGADWRDEALVRDGNLISSRKPDDLPAFNTALVSALAA
jgi:protease I